jgi:hypothetical protein
MTDAWPHAAATGAALDQAFAAAAEVRRGGDGTIGVLAPLASALAEEITGQFRGHADIAARAVMLAAQYGAVALDEWPVISGDAVVCVLALAAEQAARAEAGEGPT